MCFLRNGSSYSFETCTIVIITPENLRVHWVWPSKYKEKWYVNPKCVVFRNRSSYSLETCTIAIDMAENLRVHWVWPPKYKEKWHFSPKCVFFSEMGHYTALKLVPLWSSHLKTSECTKIGPLNTKKSDMLTQNVFFSEMDHHTALKLVPLWSSDLKTSECTKFGPLNTKKSDMLTQNVFFSEMDHHTALKLVPLWSSHLKTSECTKIGPLTIKESEPKSVFFFRSGWSYSFETCTIVIITPENLRVHWVWPTKYKEKWCFGSKCGFLRKWIIIQLWNLYHCDHHTWKPQSALSLAH